MNARGGLRLPLSDRLPARALLDGRQMAQDPLEVPVAVDRRAHHGAARSRQEALVPNGHLAVAVRGDRALAGDELEDLLSRECSAVSFREAGEVGGRPRERWRYRAVALAIRSVTRGTGFEIDSPAVLVPSNSQRTAEHATGDQQRGQKNLRREAGNPPQKSLPLVATGSGRVALPSEPGNELRMRTMVKCVTFRRLYRAQRQRRVKRSRGLRVIRARY